jgi:hypothetical protein
MSSQVANQVNAEFYDLCLNFDIATSGFNQSGSKDVFGSLPSLAWLAYGMQAGLGQAQHMQEGVVWLLASTKPG